MGDAAKFTAGPTLLACPARLRGASWADPAARPEPGERCVTCWGGWFWTETVAPRGWRCWCCHTPPVGLAIETVET